MKHAAIAAVLLAAELVFCLLSAAAVCGTMRETEDLLALSRVQAGNGDFAGAGSSVRAAEEVWNENAGLYGVVLSHADTDEVLRGFAALEQLAGLGERKDFLTRSAELLVSIGQLRKMQLPLLRNIL